MQKNCKKNTKKKKMNSENKDNILISLKKKRQWTKEEDNLLSSLVKIYDYKNWEKISINIPGRTGIQCLQRWRKILQPGLVKGPWTEEENAKLYEWVKKEGPRKWSLCSKIIPGRNGKQCCEHWNNSLNPNVKKGFWTCEEDFLIFIFYKKYGSWKKISPIFLHRTENSIKNRFYSQLRKIASCNFYNNNKQFCKKFKLKQLLNFFDFALLKAKDKFLHDKNMNEEQLDKFIEEVEQKLIQKNNSFKLNQDLIKQFSLDFIRKNNNDNIKSDYKINNNLNIYNNSFINQNKNIINNCKNFIDNENNIKNNENFENKSLNLFNSQEQNNEVLENLEKEIYEKNDKNNINKENILNENSMSDNKIGNDQNIIPNNSNSIFPCFSKTNNLNVVDNNIKSNDNNVVNILSQSDLKYKNIMDTLGELEHKVQETYKAVKSKINSIYYSSLK